MTIDNERVRLVLMDTAGEEKFGRLRQTYFSGSLGCIAVYDITRRDTLDDLDRWIAEYHKVVGEDAFVSIIGNKIDLAKHRVIPTVEGRKFARSRGFPFYESSAKIGGKVIPRIYRDLVRECLAWIKS
jgi:small GTP-binding protein